MPREYHHKRSKARKNAGDLLTLAYCVGDRQVFTLTVRPDGPHVHLTCDPRLVRGADREQAADWLKAHFPKLSHDQRYHLLFPRASA